jgi:hypothetical protein
LGPKKLAGIVLVIIGIGLAYSGYQLSETAGSQFSQAFGGGAGDSVVVRYVAGAVSAAVGAFLIK